MWKNFTKIISENLVINPRRVCRTNVYSQTQHDDSNVNLDKNNKKSCLILKNLCIDLTKYQYNFFGFFNNRGAKDKKYYFNWNNCAQRSFGDVLGWSGILALVWVICQTPCIRKHIYEKHRHSGKHCYFSQINNHNISKLLTDSISLQSKHILPVINCIPNAHNNNEEKNKFINNTNNNKWLEDIPRSSTTPEEALGVAKENFTAIHKIVMSELEMKMGVKALAEKDYKKAIEHFTNGAKLSSPGSMFNLGLCYERGLGTHTDTIKAAKLYKEAAKRGHPDAMYNLGVYYAQGRGGLKKNIKEARILFKKSANLGQHEAQTALEIENIKIKEKELSRSNKTQSTVPTRTSNIFKHQINIFSPNINFDDDLNDDLYKSYFTKDKSGNSEYYLNFLGIQPKSTPIRMEAVK